MRRVAIAALAGMLWTALGCGGEETPTSPTPQPNSTMATVRFVFLGSTSRRADLPASAQACVNGVGPTHIHPSWRNFAGIPLQPAPPDRYELTFSDVPVNTQLSLRINDQNACDENPTGAVTRNVLANDVRLNQNTTTPGNGDEPGYAFSTSANGVVSQ
ncbi:MAG: hypothetical protein ABR606_17280 [Vicinamibacterales bacterium]